MLSKNKKQYALQTRHNVSSSVIRLHFEATLDAWKIIDWSYGHIVCWSVGLLVTTNQLTNTPTNHYLLVITDHMTNIIQTG